MAKDGAWADRWSDENKGEAALCWTAELLAARQDGHTCKWFTLLFFVLSLHDVGSFRDRLENVQKGGNRCHIPPKFCILISGQDDHDVSHRSRPTLQPPNLIFSNTAFCPNPFSFFFPPSETLFPSQLNYHCMSASVFHWSVQRMTDRRQSCLETSEDTERTPKKTNLASVNPPANHVRVHKCKTSTSSGFWH